MEDDGIEYVLEEMGKQMEQFEGVLKLPDVTVPVQQIPEVSTLKEANEHFRKKQGAKFQELTNAHQSEFIRQVFGLKGASEEDIDLQ